MTIGPLTHRPPSPNRASLDERSPSSAEKHCYGRRLTSSADLLGRSDLLKLHTGRTLTWAYVNSEVR